MEYNVKTVKFQQSLFSWCSKFVKCTARPSVAISAQEELITYTFYSLHFYIEMNTNFKLLFKHPLEMFFKKGKGSSKTSAIGHAFVRLQHISPLLAPQSQASSRGKCTTSHGYQTSQCSQSLGFNAVALPIRILTLEVQLIL